MPVSPDTDTTVKLDPVYEEHSRLIANRVGEMLSSRQVVAPEYLDPKNAAIFLGINSRTLEGYRSQRDGHRGGPAYCKVGSLVRYKVSDLHDWMLAGRKA